MFMELIIKFKNSTHVEELPEFLTVIRLQKRKAVGSIKHLLKHNTGKTFQQL